MNQPPVPNVLHDQAPKWTPNDAAFSEGSYAASSYSASTVSSPGPLENAPMPALPVSLPLQPGFEIFMQMMQNFNGKSLLVNFLLILSFQKIFFIRFASRKVVFLSF
jgi:hypothetical protein